MAASGLNDSFGRHVHDTYNAVCDEDQASSRRFGV